MNFKDTEALGFKKLILILIMFLICCGNVIADDSLRFKYHLGCNTGIVNFDPRPNNPWAGYSGENPYTSARITEATTEIVIPLGHKVTIKCEESDEAAKVVYFPGERIHTTHGITRQSLDALLTILLRKKIITKQLFKETLAEEGW